MIIVSWLVSTLTIIAIGIFWWYRMWNSNKPPVLIIYAPSATEMANVVGLVQYVHGDCTDLLGSVWAAAYCNSKLVGCARLKHTGNVVELASLAVAPGYRLSGVGTQLVHHLLERSHTWSVYALCTDANLTFFTKCGFSRLRAGSIPADLLPKLRALAASDGSSNVMCHEG